VYLPQCSVHTWKYWNRYCKNTVVLLKSIYYTNLHFIQIIRDNVILFDILFSTIIVTIYRPVMHLLPFNINGLRQLHSYAPGVLWQPLLATRLLQTVVLAHSSTSSSHVAPVHSGVHRHCPVVLLQGPIEWSLLQIHSDVQFNPNFPGKHSETEIG